MSAARAENPSFVAWRESQQAAVERALSQWVSPDAPAGLGEAMRYAVLDGGKRLRPLLALATSVAVGGSPAAAMRAACAVELIHAYSLVHDDLHGMAQMSPEERAAVEAEREVTMALIRYTTPLAAVTFPRFVNEQTNMQAAAPALELTRLLTLLGAGTQVLQGFGLTLLLMAALSVFVALWQAVREREADLAMLRMLGTPPRRLVALLLTEAFALALLALLLGLALAQGLLAALGGWLPTGAATLVQAAHWSPTLLWVPLGVLLLALLAAALPAWRVHRLDVLTLLNRS